MIYFLIWYVVGFVTTILYVLTKDDLTIGDFIVCSVISILGPSIVICDIVRVKQDTILIRQFKRYR